MAEPQKVEFLLRTNTETLVSRLRYWTRKVGSRTFPSSAGEIRLRPAKVGSSAFEGRTVVEMRGSNAGAALGAVISFEVFQHNDAEVKVVAKCAHSGVGVYFDELVATTRREWEYSEPAVGEQGAAGRPGRPAGQAPDELSKITLILSADSQTVVLRRLKEYSRFDAVRHAGAGWEYGFADPGPRDGYEEDTWVMEVNGFPPAASDTEWTTDSVCARLRASPLGDGRTRLVIEANTALWPWAEDLAYQACTWWGGVQEGSDTGDIASSEVQPGVFHGGVEYFRGLMERLASLHGRRWTSPEGVQLEFREVRKTVARDGVYPGAYGSRLAPQDDVTPSICSAWGVEVYVPAINGIIGECPGYASIEAYEQPDGKSTLVYFRDGRYPWDAREKNPIGPAFGQFRELIVAEMQSAAPQPEEDTFDGYERGLKRLLKELGPDHPRYLEALGFQQRLMENIGRVRQYGDKDSLESGRAEIIRYLNQLALSVLGRSFNDMSQDTRAPSTG